MEAHSDHIKNLCKWNVADLDHFITLLKARYVCKSDKAETRKIIYIYIYVLIPVPFVNSSSHRIAAEEQYQQALMRIVAVPVDIENDLFDQFRQVNTTVKRATDEFRDSADKQAQCRRELVQVMKAQLASMTEMRETHERYRKTVKNALKDSNAAYIAYRTRDVPKVIYLPWLN